jgi:hypothetical protein
MSAVVIAYCPSSGGNHLKNLLCLSNDFANHNELDSTIYDTAHQGTVHCVSGRNVQPHLIQRMIDCPDQCWVIPAHFGEIAPYRSQINHVNKKFIVISIDTKQERQWLQRRQSQLGQQCHDYWLDEEQPWLYRADMYYNYFGATSVLTIPLADLWSPTLNQGQVIQQINKFLHINIDLHPAQILQNKWITSNFCN